MRYFNKDGLLAAATEHIARIRDLIHRTIPEYLQQITQTKARLTKLSPEDRMTAEAVIDSLTKKTQYLDGLYPSPYFIKCIARFDTDTTDRIFYFSKFPFPEEHIYSWTAPAATLRFQSPGTFTYPGGDGKPVSGTLHHKEQYLISDGHIVFMAAESTEHPRELIYQEHFSKRKVEFSLPEIVEQMEAAQDKAIRTPPTSSLLISGPAGSGKTTLALHRIAYLLQSPDTADRYAADKTLVLVNDHTTRAYFASLLPQLGITGVQITTFSDFCLLSLKLHDHSYAEQHTEDRNAHYQFEHQKMRALHQPLPTRSTEPYTYLLQAYAAYLTADTIPLWKQQVERRTLDRIDLTLLWKAAAAAGGLHTSSTEYIPRAGGKITRKQKLVPLAYSLILLDEVQNFLPEQIALLQQLRSPAGSLIYVGDLAQQTKLGTVRSWDQAGETFTDANTVRLEKVYRSTQQILSYIQSLGYTVAIPDQAREGAAVTTHTYATNEEKYAQIQRILGAHPDVLCGVLITHTTDREPLTRRYAHHPNVKILSIPEAQGVEFDAVVLCDTNTLANVDLAISPDLAASITQVNRDLLYVGLTRAMNTLYILNSEDTNVQRSQ